VRHRRRPRRACPVRRFRLRPGHGGPLRARRQGAARTRVRGRRALVGARLHAAWGGRYALLRRWCGRGVPRGRPRGRGAGHRAAQRPDRLPAVLVRVSVQPASPGPDAARALRGRPASLRARRGGHGHAGGGGAAGEAGRSPGAGRSRPRRGGPSSGALPRPPGGAAGRRAGGPAGRPGRGHGRRGGTRRHGRYSHRSGRGDARRTGGTGRSRVLCCVWGGNGVRWRGVAPLGAEGGGS
jgi:hypothetical protein